MKITQDLNYMDGLWAGDRMIQKIELTTYGDIETALEVKQALIDNFEKEFGYSIEMDEFIRDYSYNYGILDALKSHLKK